MSSFFLIRLEPIYDKESNIFVDKFNNQYGNFLQDNLQKIELQFGDFKEWGSFSTTTGWSALTTKNIYYKKTGNLVLVNFYLDGTSDATSAQFTLPYTASNIVDIYGTLSYALNNGVAVNGGRCYITKNTNILVCKQYPDTVWTNVNQKIVAGQVFYEIV